MRVLQLHNEHAGPGGAAEVVAHEAELLRGAGHDVELMAMPPAETLGLSALRAGMKAVWNTEVTRELADRIPAFQPDVVHVHTPFPLMSPAVFRTAARLNVPAVTTVHSFRYSCVAGTCHRDGKTCEACVGTRLKLPGVVHKCYHDSAMASGALTAGLVLHRALGTFNHKVSGFITLTEFSKRLLIRDGVPAERIFVKPNSVPDPGPSPEARPEQPYVAFVGRLIDVKGVRTVLDAWSASDMTGVRLRIAGDGPLRSLVEERARADSSVEFLGWIGEDEVTRLMANASCVLAPSEWYEGGVPLVVLRSLSLGTPVVVSDLDNICEDVVPAEAGVSFRVANAESLRSKLLSVVREPDQWSKRREKARRFYLDHYTPGQNVDALVQIYSRVTLDRASS